ncbi:hypothetical protein K1X22_19210 [Mycolicibacterium farcinogenes]|uniref:hypothetical protein n=1 Tax=Mycolicibacterium farcinogenes TaxID=1802 RepID=UPI001C8DC8CC|nr:hypothetical protein [Mycolicibacterium farcinogenes]QZH58407.1 hypothetical protein K1X22_19210 [Mycolicibacterium farcinogenes]
MRDSYATDLRPGDVIGRHDHPEERLMFLGVSPPAMMPTGRPQPVEALLYVLSVGLEDGTGFALPLFEDETVVRYQAQA